MSSLHESGLCSIAILPLIKILLHHLIVKSLIPINFNTLLSLWWLIKSHVAFLLHEVLIRCVRSIRRVAYKIFISLHIRWYSDNAWLIAKSCIRESASQFLLLLLGCNLCEEMLMIIWLWAGLSLGKGSESVRKFMSFHCRRRLNNFFQLCCWLLNKPLGNITSDSSRVRI
jgi:hypothetical protein